MTDPVVLTVVSLLHGEHLLVREQCSLRHANCVGSIDEAARGYFCRQVMDFMELVALDSEFLFGYSMHCGETDTDVTGDVFHRDPRISNYSLCDDFPDPCVLIVQFLPRSDLSTSWSSFRNWRTTVETVD